MLKPKSLSDLPEEQAARPINDGLILTLFAVCVMVISGITAYVLLRIRHPAIAISHTSGVESQNAANPKHLIDFALTDRSGQTVRRIDLDGQFLVVNFVFTGCSLSCLEVNYRMAEIQKQLSDQKDVSLVSLSVDPDSDTPYVLTKFAERFSTDTNRWLFLTGDKRMLYPLLEQTFLGRPDLRLVGEVPGGFVNTERITIVDKGGKVRAIFNGLNRSVTKDVITKLEQLRGEHLTH